MPEPNISHAIHTTAQQAEAAFYEAIERADLEAMMAVWAEDEEIICVHPGGPRLAGYAAVRESWRKIFAGGANLRFTLTSQVQSQGMLLAVHSLHENITILGDQRKPPPVMVTNVYIRGALGWRMLVHHASPGPAVADAGEIPKTVH
ncbi:MAG: nuclear transport factor 2 family protein [Sterolibacteriaceae bacterium]|uniref:Nuclear transport factor 2 family protein n=1 Tax=Candidatus Methylophosphatis roskildensis TaxID=2899263 RepID=A0A9D7HMP3_9PROT|nr:nuclear transport factor 2 family protein [Candidatus Methylophosphatis roskildensis]MBK7237035.1 nuclear transport factor 2 family protein [Sterolibacteriaceae bacterium]